MKDIWRHGKKSFRNIKDIFLFNVGDEIHIIKDLSATDVHIILSHFARLARYRCPIKPRTCTSVLEDVFIIRSTLGTMRITEWSVSRVCWVPNERHVILAYDRQI